MTSSITKAVILITKADPGLFPLTRCVPKELLPLGEYPIIQRIIDEVVNLKIEEVIFLSSTEKKEVVKHFQNFEKMPPESERFKEKYQEISFSNVSQKKDSGSGYVLSKIKEKIEEEAFCVIIPDNVLFGKKSAIEQLSSVYRTSQKQVLALREIKDEEVSSSDIVKTEKIANRFYKIKKILRNPNPDETDSRLALAGRYILNAAIFDYLKNSGTKTSIVDAINDLIASGKTVYGHQCEGEWLYLDTKEKYLNAQKFFLNNE